MQNKTNHFCPQLMMEKKSCELAYTSHLYIESLAVQPSVLYIPYATPSHEQTGNIITFANFEEGNLVENEHNAE